ncbi:unnamed protein product [Caenorhabditis auriculariae]|uniref:Uncharacterized protein n=1 Tax=Caenorhabditis auriculariae TaxID=2777116 RepID=A0A8S1HMB9_9PELO|nr:unnamed protein product [Caenorhabditis auriculariae]
MKYRIKGKEEAGKIDSFLLSALQSPSTMLSTASILLCCAGAALAMFPVPWNEWETASEFPSLEICQMIARNPIAIQRILAILRQSEIELNTLLRSGYFNNQQFGQQGIYSGLGQNFGLGNNGFSGLSGFDGLNGMSGMNGMGFGNSGRLMGLKK